jgi:hypothetical protein
MERQMEEDLDEEDISRATTNLRAFRHALLATMAEFLFVLLPLVVLAFVLLMTENKTHNLMTTPEWSFGAAILFGQAVQKVAAASARTQAYAWEKTTLLVSVLLIFGLVPSLITLALVINAEDLHGTSTLAYCQIILFALGSLVFMILGSVSHYLLFHKDQPRSNNQRHGVITDEAS